jgi:hypothetical protein
MDKTLPVLVQTLHRMDEPLPVLVQTLHRMDKTLPLLDQTLHRMNETLPGFSQTLHRMELADDPLGERWMFRAGWKKLKECFTQPMRHRDSSCQHHLSFPA